MLWIILAWIVCGFFTFGIAFAYVQREFSVIAKRNRREDYGLAAFAALLGPFGLIAAFLASGFAKHGWHIK